MKLLYENNLKLKDIEIVPSLSDFSLEEIDIKTKLSENLILNIPIIFSHSDTKSDMAILMARCGGIGVINKKISYEEQILEVDKVKRSQNGVISNPFYLSPNNYLYEAEKLMHDYKISGVPICEAKKLIGIITNRDMRFENDYSKKIYEVMTKDDLITAPEGINLDQAQEILKKYKIEKLPLVNDKYHLKGLITTKDLEKQIKYPDAALDSQGRLLVAASINYCNDNFIEHAANLLNSSCDVLVMDNIHAYTSNFMKKLKDLSNTFPKAIIVAGNITTTDALKDLFKIGVRIIKIGFKKIPHASSLLNCYKLAEKNDVFLISSFKNNFINNNLLKILSCGASACEIKDVTLNRNDIKIMTERLKKEMFYTGRKNITDLHKNSEIIIKK
ncbi:MAG: IMP dehydrogenase [Clostridiales bacterium]|jgi:IMP dehydrogenase|nr:IMP dehydrogenase [Clostridiales bacterium]